MSALPDFTGPGFFAGEAPDGLTTVVGTPQPAEVRVYWRDPADAEAEDVLVASTLSASNGTWRIDNLNPELQYVVRGRKAGFDDVTVVGATPSRTDVIAVEDHLQPTAEFDGLEGYVLMDSGLTPFTATVIDPLPFGLSPVIDGRKLLIEGVSDDEGIWQSTVRVTGSNAVQVDVPMQVVIGLRAPVVTARYAVDGDWTITLQLAGASAFAQELRVYRSTSPIDVEDLPDPVAVLNADVVKWVDEDVEPGQTYCYLVSAAFEQFQAFGTQVVRDAMWTPADLVVAPKVWLDDSTDVQLVSGAVAQWASKGSLGGVFSQSAASYRPALLDAALGARRAVVFDGVNDSLVASAGAILGVYRNAGVGWAFTVYARSVRRPGYQQVFEACSANGPGVTRFGVGVRDDVGYVAARKSDAAGAAAHADIKQQADLSYHIKYDQVLWSSAQARTQTDGGPPRETLSFLTPGATDNTNSLRLTLGCDSAMSAFAAVKIAAVIAGSGSLPAEAEIQRLEGWAAHRYGLTDNLPADHPYKLTPP